MSSRLSRNPDFLKLWVGQTISEIGSYITGDGLPLTALLLLSASPEQLGLLSAVMSLPVLVFSLFAGVWVDRVRRRPLMIAADLGRCVILLSIPVAALTGHLNLTLVCIVGILTSALSLLFNTAYRAALPVLVQRERLLDANTKLAMTSSAAEIGAPSLAGVLIQTMTAPLAIVFDALSFLLSALSLMLIRKPEAVPTPQSQQRTIAKDIGDGLRILWHQPLLRVLVTAAVVKNFFGSFYGVLYAVLVIQELGYTPLVLGLLVGMGGVGALLGTFLAARRRYILGRVLGVMVLVNGVTLAFLLSDNALHVLLVLAFSQLVGDAAAALYGIYERSLSQMLVPDHLLGRANASVSFLTQGVMPLGALVAGLLAGGIGVRETLWLASLGFMFTSLWVLCSPVRKVDMVSMAEA